MALPTGHLPPGLNQPASFPPSSYSTATLGNSFPQSSIALGVSPVKPVTPVLPLSPGSSALINPVSPLKSGSPGFINPASPASSLSLSPGMANPVSPLSGYGGAGSLNPMFNRGGMMGPPRIPLPPPPVPFPRYMQPGYHSAYPQPVQQVQPAMQPVQQVMMPPPSMHPQYVHPMPATQLVQAPPPVQYMTPPLVQSVSVLQPHYVQQQHPQYVMAVAPPPPPPPPPLPSYIQMQPALGPATFTVLR